MGIADDILVPMAALGGAGAAIDFYLGTPGQKRVKAWLADKWYRFHDVNWHNFAEKEAQAYIDFVDRVFGASLLSWRRLISSVVLVLFVTAALAIHLYFFRGLTAKWTTIAQPMLARYFFASSAIDCCAFALSISFARWISLVVVRLNRRVPGILPFLLLLLLHYVLLVLWRPIIDIFVWIPKVWSLDLDWSDLLPSAIRDLAVAFAHLAVTPKEIAVEYYYALPRIDGGFYFGIDLVMVRAWIMSLIANGLRLLFALVLLSSFVVRAWVGPAFSTTWARLVESDKPIFTIAFSAVAAVATTLKELVKLL